jgi:hypothetical protein
VAVFHWGPPKKEGKTVYKNSESSPEESNTVLLDLEPESARTCIEHAVVFRATTVPAGSDVDVVVDGGDPDTVSSSFPFSRRFVPGLHTVTVSPSGGSEGLSAEVRASAVKIEVLEPADKRTAITADFFLEPCVSHRLPWMVVRIAQGNRV